MVKRMVPRKVGIQADHVKFDKHLALLKSSSSQHQDGKSKGFDKMNEMKESRSIKRSDLEHPQSPPSVKSLFQSRQAPLLHVPTIAALPQQQKPLVRRSPNYMKPTTSSDAKKELLLVSLQNTPSGSNGKNPPRKCSSISKATNVSSKDPANTLSRSSSLNSVRTLTKSPSFMPCKACSRKSTSAVLFEDMNAPDKATCSSTLKDSKFPAYLTLHPGGTESEGASVMKVCPYAYCSLNDHGHASLPPLKSFMSARRHLLETQKNIKPEVVSPRRLKVPRDTKEDSDIEQVVLDGKLPRDEADKGNPIITSLVQEIDRDFFIEIYDEEKERADKMGRFNSVKDLEDKKDMVIANEKNGTAAEENDIKQVIPVEADSKGSFHLEQNAEDADENHPPGGFHEETCTRSYCDGKHQENIELDESDSQYTDMDWEEEKFREFNYEEDIGSSIRSMDETGSKLESLSECSHDTCEMWLDDIFSSHDEDILVEKTPQEAEEKKSTCFEPQHHCTNFVQEGTNESIELDTQEKEYPSNNMSFEYNQYTLTEEVFQNNTDAGDNSRENDKYVDYEASCVSMVLDAATVVNSEGHKTSDTCKIDDSQDSKVSQENNDDKIRQNILEENQVKSSKFQSRSCTGGEEQHTSKKWQCATKRKRPMEDDEEMRKINPRKPNLLPMAPDPEPQKVDLKHQMIDERKNAEEWMLDFALRQTVTRLAPAGKKKVALLVEAFETVMSIPKCETRMRNDSPFAHARPIQACS
ncbi:uncharacterized protein LOC113865206 [Abrus precatorius]|uniref:Uncharacterized protein LOC113865206 n=1 Tax=Abrus precatorius TaxID=3816 RepID=A0A8B8LJ88_ABRPR|nr:uncharacterized protein LOC113865206 [Abrus precatorius]